MGTKWNGLNRNKQPRKTRPKTTERNKRWREIVLQRAEYLKQKYGTIVCEYSGEPIYVLSSVLNDFGEGWGHHIDRNRRNCVENNCYIVKYCYHRLIHLKNIQVQQEDFQGKLNENR